MCVYMRVTYNPCLDISMCEQFWSVVMRFWVIWLFIVSGCVFVSGRYCSLFDRRSVVTFIDSWVIWTIDRSKTKPLRLHLQSTVEWFRSRCATSCWCSTCSPVDSCHLYILLKTFHHVYQEVAVSCFLEPSCLDTAANPFWTKALHNAGQRLPPTPQWSAAAVEWRSFVSGGVVVGRLEGTSRRRHVRGTLVAGGVWLRS